MLILTYVSGTDGLGCINLEKTKTILFVELRTKSIVISIDNETHYFPLTSIFTSIGEDGKDVSTDIDEIIKFEQENDLTNGMYKSTLPQLIMLYSKAA